MFRTARLGLLAAAALLASAACEARDVPPGDSSGGLDPRPTANANADVKENANAKAEANANANVEASANAEAKANATPAVALPPASSFAEAPLACATLRDVTTSDVVKVDGTTLFYAETATGLTIVDVSDAASPRRIASVPFVGTPLALFVREGIAWVVFIDYDARFTPSSSAATVVRAVDVRTPAQPKLLGDEIRDGVARDAELVGGILYTLRSTHGGSAVESFAVAKGALASQDAVVLEGAPAQLAPSSAGLAAVTVADRHSTVAWLDLPLERPGSMMLRASVRVPGGVAVWEHGGGRIADADEGQRVRLVTCATRSCGPSEPATLRIVEFGQAPARLASSLEITKRGGLPLTRFANEMLYVGETTKGTPDTTTLRTVRTDEATPRISSSIVLEGLVTGLVPRDTSLVALGTKATTPGSESQVKIVLHDLDIRRPWAPRLRASATFGSDWTWTVALDDDAALSFDPASHLVAVPFTAWRHVDGRYVTGTQLVDLGRLGAQNVATYPSDGYVERAVFLDGHLVTIGPDGIAGIDYGQTRRPGFAERQLELAPSLPAVR